MSIKPFAILAALFFAAISSPVFTHADETRPVKIFGEDSLGRTVIDGTFLRTTAENRTGRSAHRALPLVTGAKNIAFILFSMPGGTNPVTNADVVRTMQTGWFGSGSQTVATIFAANSFGAVSVGGYHTFGPLPLSLSIAGVCDGSYYTALDTAMNNAISSAALDLSSYDYLIYVLPTQMASFCGWSGITWGPDAAALSGDVNPVVTSHEIGHLFGMGHSTYDPNNDGEIVPEDGDREYGDPSCIMGGFGRFYNLAHQERQDWWLAAGGNLAHSPSTGVYTSTLSPFENSPASVGYAPQAVQVDVSDGSKYIVTFAKNPTPGDPSFDMHETTNNHVFVTRVYPLNSKTYLISVLGEGQSYLDSVQGVTFEFISQSGSTASVRISHGDIDSDGDGQPNSVDMDDDNDGVVDSDDCAPLSPTHWRVVNGACIGATVPTPTPTPGSYPTLSITSSTKVTTKSSSVKILGTVKNGPSNRGAAATLLAPGKTAYSMLKGVSISSRTSITAAWSYTVKTPKKGVYQVKIFPCSATTCSTASKTVKITRK